MKFALRKLIAFVFLLGIAWYIYRDLDNIWNQNYMTSIGGLVVIFAAFWLLVPLAVVWLRIWKRKRKNRRGYALWLEEIKPNGPRPHRPNHRLHIDPSEHIWFHEKGTLYVKGTSAYDAVTVKGRIGDVAFPHEPREWRKAQRVHCYFTDRRILFLGKEIDCDIPFSEVGGCRPTVGGLVFDVKKDDTDFYIAFTFVNPLIASDVYHRIVE